MAAANPAIDPPRLPSPTKKSLHSRSPSRSPVRQHHARDADPLLRDLSPTTTLRAFRSDVVTQGQLGKSLENASPAQRALGAKAAQACIDLRSWAREIEAWEWPGSFEVPEPVRKKQRISSMSLGSLASRPSMSRSQTQESEDVEEDYWGSLPAATVQRYEQRLDEIEQGLDAMDVEELKDFVLSAHSQASFGGANIDDSIGAIGADTNLRHLDDFTALITATILSALPFLSRLNRLLNTWSIRLRLLRVTPKFLSDLRQARADLDHGWAALAVSKHPAAADAMKKSNATFSRDTMTEMKNVISKQVHSLGRRLDAFLDELEGRQEVVPERWIEEFEVLEEQYGRWVVQAERKVIEDEWASAKEDPAAEDDEGVGFEDRPDTATTVTVGPTITSSTAVGSGMHTNMNTSTHTTTSGPMTTTVTTVLPQSSPDNETRGREISPARDRPRHVPIVVDSYISKPDLPTPMAELPTTTSVTTTARSISPLPRSNTPKSIDSASSQNVKKRAAFLNGEIEKGDGLIKSKPAPIVRPFERASNAFTRLFKEKEGSKDEEESAFGPTVDRKNSKDDGLAAAAKSKGMSSSTSLKGILGLDKKDEKRDSGGRGSRKSGASSPSSKKGASSVGRPSTEQMEYGDMVRPPGTPKSEKSRGRRSTFGSRKSPAKDNNRGAMEYGDMARMPEFERQEIESRSRGSTMSKEQQMKIPAKASKILGYGDMVAYSGFERQDARDESQPSTMFKESRPKNTSKSNKSLGYGDLVAYPEPPRVSEESKSTLPKRPTTPKRKESERTKAKQALEYGDPARVPDQAVSFKNLSGSQGAAKYQPDYLAPAAEPADTKRTIRQNITALPSLQTPSATGETQTYRPTGLHSPFHTPIEPDPHGLEVPEDWPLSNVPTPRQTPSPIKEDGPRLQDSIPEADQDERAIGGDSYMGSGPAFATDAFDRQFVSTIPAQPVKRPVSRDRGPDETEFVFKDSPSLPHASGEVIPHVDSDEEDDGAIIWTSKSSSDRSWMRTGASSNSRRLDWPEPPARSSSQRQETNLRSPGPRPVSMVEEAEEGGSSSADESEEEFVIKRRSDNAAGYFGGGSASKSKSAANSATANPRGIQRSNSNPPVSPGYLKLRSSLDETAAASTEEASASRSDQLFRRASTTSIESHPRSELKSVEIARRSSVGSPRDSAPTTPIVSRRESVEGGNTETHQSPTSPLHYKTGIVFPSPPSIPARGSSLNASPEAKPKPKEKGELAVQKRKKGTGRREMLSSPTKDLEPGEDNFDRHVHEVLDRVHAPIKFRTRPGAETPQPLSSRPARLPKATERKNMTLAPAESSPRKANPADPEVKLYHLTQSGRSEPIKLYVRLVGEGERVMVRVGGGWADLADYLKQYAEHHGSRTVSEGTLELQTASAANGNASGLPAAKRTFSGPPSALGESKSSKSPITPLSAFPALERPRTRDSEKSWLEREQPEFSMGDSDNEQAPSPSIAYTRDIAPPRRSSLLSSSRPSTAQSVRPSDASLEATGSSPIASTPLGGPGGGLSLAGPSKLKAELPEQKARWVEGMIQQVNKSASAEKSREEKERYVADMGKVGGVRRVAFRSASGTTG